MLNTWTSGERDRLARAAALAVCALAGALCIWLAVHTIWLLLPHADTEFATPALPAPGANTGASAGSIAKWHLFGNPQGAVDLSKLAHSGPATSLKLTLHGTWARPDPKAGIAMIADDQGSERAYNIGEEVASGVKLVEVYTNRVLLSHDGAIETLELPRPEEHAATEAAQANSAAATSAPKGKTGPITPVYTPPVMANGAVNWSDVQKKYKVNPEELAKQIHVEQVMENGKFTGVRLSGGANAELLSQLGLKPTDVVTAVNGTPLSGLSNAQQLIDGLKNSAQLQVTVQRDGKPATLTVNLK